MNFFHVTEHTKDVIPKLDLNLLRKTVQLASRSDPINDGPSITKTIVLFLTGFLVLRGSFSLQLAKRPCKHFVLFITKFIHSINFFY